MLRDMNKARIAFDGAREIATGHWGCGAFGNNHDLMFLKQWLAASEAGAARMHYHDFSRNQSHNIVPLTRRLQRLFGMCAIQPSAPMVWTVARTDQ